MTKYQPVIGLEVHVELNTETKMFCRCNADYFGKKPNTHTCPVCLGLPGALPYINKEAIKKCLMIGLALNCSISPKSLFERKNYFYPDLPKGYQISQYRWPLNVNGYLEVEGVNGKKKIRINRAHQEEDTAKLVHQFETQNSNVKSQNYSYLDFNRSGVPLVEIVTEPDFTDPSEVKDYAKKLQQIFRYLEVSNADMERGDMRLEANVSIRTERSTQLPNYRVELKNINSFRFMVAAIDYEIKRQIEVLEKGGSLSQETRGWNEDKKCTYLQRSKEEANDYRYFPEPDLPKLRIMNSELGIKEKLPELPDQKAERFIRQFGIKISDAKHLTETKFLAEFFEQAVNQGKKHTINAGQIANFLINKKPDIENISPAQVVEQIKGKAVGIIGDIDELKILAEEVVKENPRMVEDYKKGKNTVIQALIGKVMKKTLGKADASKTKKAIEELLRF